MDDSLNGNVLPIMMSGSFQETCTDHINGNTITNLRHPIKRRRLEESEEMTSDRALIRGRSFLPVRSGNDVYSTENWKASGSSLFAPVNQDMYINVNKYEQITAAQGSFHTADASGNFMGQLMGHVVHFWRYDKQQHNLYISLSVLYTNSQDFHNVHAFVQNA